MTDREQQIADSLEYLADQGHPAVAHLLKLFKFAHLPDRLRSVSFEFAELACSVASGPSNAETTVALRKLLEAKDCAVRAYAVHDD